ncbi:hypothetical protein HPB48_010559 [Haemaphysalis longicornis]|uniref:Ionotropic receptor n=1 Tax=Haemaphysalis longicornis TaxID=44386 RepID=A0A9J6H505_HAELO|nr:hypothetical protein HPB48_010559 [Haemaphysalis longicornis]
MLCHINYAIERHNPKHELTRTRFEHWLAANDDFSVLSCNNHTDGLGVSLSRIIPKALTSWSNKVADFRSFLEDNAKRNVRTLVHLKVSRRTFSCVESALLTLHPASLYALDWVVEYDENHLVGRIKSLFKYKGTYDACDEDTKLGAARSKRSELFSNVPRPLVFSRRCRTAEIGRQTKWSEAFGSQSMAVACLPEISSTQYSLTTCNEVQFYVVFEILSELNATVWVRHYDAMSPSIDDMLRGKADILMALIQMDTDKSKYVLFPNVFEYRHYTFYAWRVKEEKTVSLFDIISSSKAACTLLLLTASVAWLALSFGRFLQLDRNSLSQVLADSLLSIVGTFLSVCDETWDSNGRPSSRHYICSHKLVFAVWLMGIFPFSGYFRGELTSRLTAKLPPNHVDTVDELHAELDRRRLLPCVVKGSSSYWHLRDGNRANDATLFAKLRKAYIRNEGEAKLTFKYVPDCFRCAKKPGFVCFSTARKECSESNLGPDLVESRERLNLALYSTPTRKDFPHADAYRHLLERIFETGLNLHAFNDQRDCFIRRKKERSFSCSTVVAEEQVTQLSELAEFFAWFLALLGLSVLLLAGELVASFAWKQRLVRAKSARMFFVRSAKYDNMF